MRADFVQAGRVTLQFFEDGEGPEVLVLVHGYQSSGRVWRLTQEAMATKGLHTFAVSSRGAGDSDRTSSEADYSIESLANDLYEAVEALGLNGFTLCGHSMGGAVAAKFSLDHPELLKALVLLDSASLVGRGLAPGWEAELRESIARTGAPPARQEAPVPAPADFQAALQADIDRNPIERWVGSRRSMSELRLRDRLSELRIPVLVVGGDQDITAGIETILHGFLALPEATRFVHVFHGVGHSPNVAVPEDFAHLVHQFVTRTIPEVVSRAIPAS